MVGMNLYEGMFIFPQSMKDDEVEKAMKTAIAEIEKAGGKAESPTRLGHRNFARPMAKQESGHYVVVNFQCAGDKIDHLLGRYKLNEDVFRVQIVRAEAASTQAPEATKEKSDGVAE